MNENIKTFSLVVITICVFIMTVIDILNMVEEKNERSSLQTYAAPVITPVPTQPSTSASATDQEISKEPKTAFKFDEMVFDFGNVNEGEVVKHKFPFTNSGSNPLIISEAHGSCGCTIPSYPKEPIPPGGKADIEVQFNSTGKQGLQNKSVTITANTDPPQTIINITANVVPKK